MSGKHRSLPPRSTKLILDTRDENVSIGGSMDMLRRLCKDDKEVLDLIDQAVQRCDGSPPETVDNVNILDGRPTGNSEQAASRRLRKDRPDLLEKVKQGEMTVTENHQALGIRSSVALIHCNWIQASLTSAPISLDSVRFSTIFSWICAASGAARSARFISSTVSCDMARLRLGRRRE
jgi:hypothetical protein